MIHRIRETPLMTAIILLTNVNDPQKHPSTTETRVISEATKRKSQTNSNEKKSLDRTEESKHKTVTIMGDSMISYQDEKLHTNILRH